MRQLKIELVVDDKGTVKIKDFAGSALVSGMKSFGESISD